MTDAASEHLEPALDLSPARWVVDSLPDFAARVAGSLVPAGYDMYVRVLHPARRRDDGANDERGVSWAEVAKWSGRVLHPLAQWHALSTPRDETPQRPRLWDGDEPSTGNLSDPQLDALIPLLAHATTEPASCWFCLWDGFGFLHPGSISVSRSANPWSEPAGEPWRAGRDVSALPRLRLPNRDYLVFRAPVAAARFVGRELGPYALPWREGPNLWWPDDRAWVVASEIDLHSTYVACAAPLGAALLASDDLECFAVSPDDRFGFDSDRVNER